MHHAWMRRHVPQHLEHDIAGLPSPLAFICLAASCITRVRGRPQLQVGPDDRSSGKQHNSRQTFTLALESASAAAWRELHCCKLFAQGHAVVSSASHFARRRSGSSVSSDRRKDRWLPTSDASGGPCSLCTFRVQLPHRSQRHHRLLVFAAVNGPKTVRFSPIGTAQACFQRPRGRRCAL